MATVTVNGKDIQIGDDERLNLVQAAQRAGVEVPHYCWHPSLSVVASCRMCLVEAGDKKPDGSVAMQPKLVPACQTPAKNGSVFITDSEKVKTSQKATLEYLLLNHPLDCPTCDQAGECFLQDYSFKYGKAESRLQEPKLIKPDKDHIGEHITLFTDRCILCSRCVRFTREISGTAELQITERGSHSEIDIFPGEPCNNKLAGNVVDLCPVGALCSKDFLYKQRVWWLRSQKSVCPDCSTGCSITVDQNENKVYRLRPRVNPQAQGHFMCDEGRFGFKYLQGEDRLLEPIARKPASGNGKPVAPLGGEAAWTKILADVRADLAAAVAKNPGGVFGVLSPWMTCEEAYLFAGFMMGLAPTVRLALGPVHVVGEDDLYPKGRNGEPLEPIKFTIRAEKCPNRNGVEAILRHFDPGFVSFADFVSEANAGKVDAAYLVGGYNREWLGVADVAAIRKIPLIVLQDILKSPVADAAHYVLPGGSFAEKDGTFVNHAGLAQKLNWAIRSPESARPDGRILMEVSGRTGLFHAETLRREIGSTIAYFSTLADRDPGDNGVMLEEIPTKVKV